uniref:Uncharacterized protein n=1 Tax=Opuntia streptacantha TaxID=393608 RepID=A0A7C9A1J9_OPUST
MILIWPVWGCRLHRPGSVIRLRLRLKLKLSLRLRLSSRAPVVRVRVLGRRLRVRVCLGVGLEEGRSRRVVLVVGVRLRFLRASIRPRLCRPSSTSETSEEAGEEEVLSDRSSFG